MTGIDALRALPVPELVAALAGLTEKERKALAPAVAARTWDAQKADGSRHVLLALGCAGSARALTTALEFAHLADEDVPWAARVVRDRRPAWLPKLPDALAAVWFPGWRLVRLLVVDGLLERPSWYLGGMVPGLVGHQWAPDVPAVLDALRADPALLDDDVWAMLASEDGGGALAWHDKHFDQPRKYGPWGDPIPPQPEKTWRHALVTLAAEGALDRARLLDLALAAYLRDWHPQSLPWFVGFHDALAPTVDELAARQETYARLLAVAYGPAVLMAQRAFTALVKAGRADTDLLLGATPAVLLRGDKGPVVAHLKLLAALAKARPALAGAVAAAAAVALEHERADVRERAAALGATAAVPVVQEVSAEPAVARSAPAPVVPVADADELAGLFARLIEETDDPVEAERALEGAARLARQRPRHGGAALAARARELLGDDFDTGYGAADLRPLLAWLAVAWLTGDPGPGRVQGRWTQGGFARDTSLGGFVAYRVQEVVDAVAAGGATLLSLPTSADGAVAADALAERLRTAGSSLPYDTAVAALRVAPGAAVAAPAGHPLGRALEVLAAYDPLWKRVTGAPLGPREPQSVTWRDARAPSVDGPLAAVLGRGEPFAEFYADSIAGGYAARYDQVVGTWTLLLPHHPELLAAHGHVRLDRGLRGNRSGSGPLLDAFGRSPVRTGPVTCSALAFGLAVNNPGDRTRAVDAVIDLARAGLLDAAELGRQAALSFGATALVPKRVADSLAEVARGGRAASAAVLAAVTALLPALPGRREAHAFVDLLARVATEHAATVTLPDELAAIARGRSSSVLAAACRRVPQP